MKPFFPFFLILMLAGIPALVLGWNTPESFDQGYDVEHSQAMTQNHDEESPDDGDEEKEDDDYD